MQELQASWCKGSGQLQSAFLIGITMGDATSVQMASITEMTCVGAVNLQSMLRDFHDHRYQSPSHVGYCASCLTVVTNVMEGIFFQVEGVVALASIVSTPAQERHIRSLAAGVATAQAPFSVNQNWQQVGNCSGLDKLQLAWPEAALPWCAAGHGRSVFAAAYLAVSRYLATAGLFDGTQLHSTPARRDIPRRPSNLTFVAVPKLKE